MNTHIKIRWQVALLILLACLPAYAQQRTRQRRPAPSQGAQREAQEREQRRRDEEQVSRLPDVGADLAYVTALKADVYEQPAVSGRVLLSVKRGDVLALIERAPQAGWYKVIDVSSAAEGWIQEQKVVIKLTANRENAPPLEEEDMGDQRDPELSVQNLETATDLSLRINGKLHVVRAGTTKTLTLKPGRYDYYGWSRGVSPAIGGQDLRSGTRYSWTFRIVRR